MDELPPRRQYSLKRKLAASATQVGQLVMYGIMLYKTNDFLLKKEYLPASLFGASSLIYTLWVVPCQLAIINMWRNRPTVFDELNRRWRKSDELDRRNNEDRS